MMTTKELTGRIFNIQKYSIYDGDGIRTLIFFKGCNISCPWCSNPEGLNGNFQVMYSHDKCIDCGACVSVCPSGTHYRANINGSLKHFINREAGCSGCRKCEEICTQDAISIVGKDYTVSELMEVIMQDYFFYTSSGGGVTIGGGEMSLQTDFAVALFSECKKVMINTAVETQGTTPLENYKKLAAVTDTFLFDLKEMDSANHKTLFGMGNERVKRNLEWLVDSGANVVVRIPLVRGYNDSEESVLTAIDYIKKLSRRGNIRRIDILPYHQLGKSKYQKLDMNYPVLNDPSYTPEELNYMESRFKTFDFDIRLVRH
ncbi:choline TMA-lyase-activating enzyme [Erwinia sp. S38]|uniref:choline TMA-lyase-activating enzyme n=1 Tax=Erwinia sp. S38 TaxID=2769338 RepID=UPI0019095342|nr:choline TMA-lyase-activating enzyme [Erwinia sp. S38]MBJ9999957.1 choline TMA-lyase-activating enzyme [Erwinia sp. S38]